LAQVERKSAPLASPYPGYPLEVGTRAAEAWFYGVLPVLIITAWITTQGRIPLARAPNATRSEDTLSVDGGGKTKGDPT